MTTVLRLASFVALAAVLLFGAAGRWNVGPFWAYIGIIVVYGVAMSWWVIDPELREERLHPAPGGTDRAARFLGLPIFLVHWVVAGLSLRLAWPDQVGLTWQVVGLVLLAAGLAFSAWAMRVNRFFSPVVRIQSERGHHVISDGPYRYVRHPGYAAFLVCMVGSGLSLGSLVAAAVVIPYVLVLFRRAALEDRYLHEHLDGYPEYASRVRFRIVPGVW